ncbi:hypothetical protein SASPL_137826 [Salvia splendens]|uniref:Cyclin-dependent kinase inhibitor n=1 Tax=Salvia splendens TaxID=180675 RepID=A0A8X8WVY3_SALSN|nr:cyclin-dependent kinase inhibitor 4-like [Salvia splendens]KAG6400981.1 hypothetical protein SASPL_137826 [Salvia splendens]
MGKYMRTRARTKNIDVSHSPFGVRTRARTLALKSSATDFLQLRSRRLQKPPLLEKYLHNSPKAPPPPKQCLVSTHNQNPQIEPANEVGNEASQMVASEIEASFGENDFDTEPRQRCTRESTPCSTIGAAGSITAHGSSTKQISPNVSNQRAPRTIPTPREMDEFFSHAEQPHDRLFIEKYNFDIVNDLPLPGRYEWVRSDGLGRVGCDFRRCDL